jgi:hypothetical protein
LRISPIEDVVQQLHGATNQESDLLTLLRKGGKGLRELRRKLREQQLNVGEAGGRQKQIGGTTTQEERSVNPLPLTSGEPMELGGAKTGIPDQVVVAGKVEAGVKKKRGRPRITDPKADQQIVDAWGSGQYKTHGDLGKELRMKKEEVTRVLNRHQKRQKAAEKTQSKVNSPEKSAPETAVNSD